MIASKAKKQMPHGAIRAPMPDFVRPMLTKLIDKPFDDENWLFEIKYDGYRALAHIRDGKVHLYSRNKQSFNRQFAAIAEALKDINFNALLDGEIVALDSEGVPHFQFLQNYEAGADHALVYYVFDLLWYNGYDLKNAPLLERKTLLRQIFPDSPTIRYSDQIQGIGVHFFEAVAARGLEGIVGKRADSTYQPGKRTGAWVKIKSRLEQEAIICGYTEPKGSRQYFGSLVLGAYNSHKQLEWIGSSGGGFDENSLEYIYKLLQPLQQTQAPFARAPRLKTVHWVKPKLVCQVSFSEWTQDGSMRQPVFMGMRPDKTPKEVKKEGK